MEIIYSDVIFAFIIKCKKLVFNILKDEMGIKVGRSRFYIKNTSYPIQLIVFEHPSKLGYFQADLFEIGVNKTYLFEEDNLLIDLLRHELAHYMTFIQFGLNVHPHGKEFHQICKKYNWNSEVSRAVIKIEKNTKNKKIIEKVVKLLSLAKSPHIEEAEAATLKAQELVLKYSLDLQDTEREMHLLRFFPRKRNSTKLHAISSILRTFCVHPIFNHGKNIVYLEILGEKTHVEIAEYIAYFLDRKFEQLWKKTKTETPNLKGLIAKNSFFRGIAQGYLEKSKSSEQALIKVENQLINMAESIYPQLVKAKTFFKNHKTATKIGQEKGKLLSINHGIQKKHNIKLIF